MAAETAAVALQPSSLPESDGVLDPLLWSDVRVALLPMLESVRDKSRSLLMEC